MMICLSTTRNIRYQRDCFEFVHFSNTLIICFGPLSCLSWFTHIYIYINHICVFVPDSAVSHSSCLSLRFHRGSCTLPRCHKERRCRSHRTARQVCVCLRENEKKKGETIGHSFSWAILHGVNSIVESLGTICLQTECNCCSELMLEKVVCLFVGKKMNIVYFSVSVCCMGQFLARLRFTLSNLLFEIILNICVSLLIQQMCS